MRDTAIERLQNAKTYLYLDGIDEAIAYYVESKDTTSLLQMYQIASIKMRWNGEQDSAATYLNKALAVSTQSTTPSKSDIFLDLARLYSHPLLKKDYAKALIYSQKAAEVDMGRELHPRIMHDIGLYYSFMGKQDSAIVYLDSAIRTIPKGSPLYATFALNYANLPAPDVDKSISYLDNIESGSLGQLLTKGFLYLNQGSLDSAQVYLKQSQSLYDAAPERFSINTYNNLRLLANCVSFARTGRVYPGDGTVTNDSVSERVSLNQRIDAERTERNAMIEIKLLKTKSRNLSLGIVVLVLIMISGLAFAMIYWKNKNKYIQLSEELDRLRQNQIVV